MLDTGLTEGQPVLSLTKGRYDERLRAPSNAQIKTAHTPSNTAIAQPAIWPSTLVLS